MNNNSPSAPPLPPTTLQRQHANMEFQSRKSFDHEEVSTTTRILRYLNAALNTLNHMLAAVVVFFAVGFSIRNPDNITLHQTHIIMCVIGYQMIMVQGILSMNPKNTVSRDLPMSGRKLAHIILQGCGSLCVITGTSLQIYNRGGLFITNHGIIGLTAMIVTILASLTSISALFAHKLKSVVKPGLTKLCHIFFGSTALIMGITTICLGLDKASFRTWSTDSVATMLIVMCIFTCLYVLVSPIVHMYQRTRSSF